ncbi:MAG: tetratricopeptide repeat protein [Planctomycetes bacterium]|nr:tetratricopeptide repeat protein [Planctomycetota bacterium]
MRRLNIKFWIQFNIVILAMGIGVPLLHAYNVGRSAKVVLSKAQDAYKRHELRDALRYYTEYIRSRPGDDEQRAKQALVAAEITRQSDVRSNDVLIAYGYLEQALRQEGLRARRDLRRQLVDILVMRRMVDEARKSIDLLNATGKPDPELDYLYAQCASSSKYFEQAQVKLNRLVGYDPSTRKFNSARATAPNNVDAYALLARILLEQKELVREADAVIDQMVLVNPKSPQALIQRSTYLSRTQREGTPAVVKQRRLAAKEDLRQALKIDPNNVDALLQNAVLCAMDNDLPAARESMQQALKIRPNDERIYLQMAQLLAMDKQPQEAVKVISQGLALLPKSPELVWSLHEYQLQMGDVAAARKTIERMSEVRLVPERIALAKARIPMVEQNWAEAARQLEIVRPQLGSQPALALKADLHLGKCYGLLRQFDRQLEAFSRILQTWPDNVDALRGKAAAQQALGRYAAALETYQKGLYRALGAQAFTADKGLMRSYYGLLTIMVRRDPENQMLAQLKDRVGAAIAGAEAPLDPNLSLVDKAMRDKDWPTAITLLNETIKTQPKDIRFPLALVSVLAKYQGAAPALAKLAEVEKQFGASAATISLHEELIVQKGGIGAKQALAETEPAIAKLSKEEQIQLWTRLGGFYLRLGQMAHEDVRRCWQKAADMQPGNTGILENLFELARETGDNVGMLKALGEIEKSAGRDSSTWKYAEASRLVAVAKERSVRDPTALDDARELLQKLSENRRDWYRPVRLQAEISDIKGEQESAIREYQRALDLGPADYGTVRRLVELYLQRDQIDDARKALRRLGENPVGMERAQALIEALGGDKAKALSAINRAVPDESKNPADFLWKGQLLLRIDEQDKAEQAFRRAVALGPDQPDTWLALVEYLARANKVAAAEQVIRDAENELSDDQVPTVLGSCYAMLGANDQAEHYYLSALSAQPDKIALQRAVAAFYLGARAPNQAAPYLSSIISAAPRIRPDEVGHLVWARRQMATLLAQSNSYAQFLVAVRLIESNAVSGVIGPDDTALLARMYGQRRDAASLQRSLDLLERLKKMRPLSVDDQLLLSQVCLATQQPEIARNILVDLAADKKADTRVLAALADALLKRNEPRSAQPWIRKLEELQPKSEETTALACRLAVQLNDLEKAEAIIDGVMPQKFTPANMGQLLAAGRFFEELKFYPAAEKKFRKYAAESPAGWIELAGYLGRRGNVNESFKLLKANVSDASLPQVALQAVGGLRALRQAGKPIPDSVRQQTLAWFDQAEKKAGVAVALQLEHAGLLDVLDRPDDAQQVYLAILKNPKLPEMTRAMTNNNLAFLIAIHGGDQPLARQLIDSSIQLLGPLPELLDTQAMVAIAQGRPQEAVKILTEATQFGGSPEVFLHLAVAQQLADDRLSAGRTLRRAQDEGLRKERLSKVESQQLDKLTKWLKS